MGLRGPDHTFPAIAVAGHSRSRETLTTGQAARCCLCSIQTVIRAVDTGTLAGFRLPGSRVRRVLATAVIDWLERSGLPVPDELRAKVPPPPDLTAAG